MTNELHQKVFEFMESYRSSQPDFVYWLRERNTNNRLDEGVWFQGTDNYAFVGLYNRGGGTNMTRSIGLVFYPKDDKIACEFENVFNEEADKKILKFYNELRSLVGDFNQIGKTKYKKVISDEDGFAGAKIFLDTIKPQIDNLVQKHGLDNLFIKPDKFKKSINAIMARQNNQQVDSKSMFKSILVNLTWSSSDWQDVSDDKSGHKWVKAGNTPHESWNFDFENIRNTVEYIKGFAQFTNPPKVQGVNNLIIFVSQNQIVGFYGKTEVLEVPEVVNDHESYNLVAHKDISLVLKNKITDIKNKGYLETKEKIGQIGFCYIEKLETIQKIIQEAITLNPIESNKLNNLLLWVESEHHPEKEIIMKQTKPLNQILYGPPGTGKTYNTINKAIEIINPKFVFNLDRKLIKEEFERLVNEGQIVFTTFHQSMSYEDFIEGIKPQKAEDNDEFLRYYIEPGVFKSICNKAKSIKQTNNKIDWDTPKYYKMSLGGKDRPDLHEWCIDNNVIALGWGGIEDLKKYSSISNWQDYREKFTKQFPELVKESRFNIQATYAFMNMKENDIVIISKGNHLIDAIGVVKGSYYWDDKNPVDFYHYRQVEWVVKNVNTTPDRFFKKQISQMAIYEFYPQDIIKEAFKEITGQTAEATSKPYVLIIDEINRGNVSQIFGELITLIEEDKRLGNSEALEVTLPYSKEKFGVPPNLHIIGTMNTADRSVEALDTALRRRFSFEEIQSKPELVAPNRCLWELLWKYKGVDWDNKEYKSKEKELLDLLGASPKIWDERKPIWEQFKTEGKNESQIEMFSNNEFNGINFKSILEIINLRIEKLLDKDHQIGHSYFMCVTNLVDLKSVFHNKIIPLLQEYFFGDYGKIGLVLGASFVRKEVNDNFRFATFKGYEDQSDLLERPVYTITNSDNWDFKSIYE